MRYLHALLVTLIIGFAIGCKKGDQPVRASGGGGSTGGNVGGLALAGTEYWGTMLQEARQWPKPILIHFNADSTVIDYCYFSLYLGNSTFYEQDSLIGQIISSAPGTGDSTELTIYFKAIADTQVYTFPKDLSVITGGSLHWTTGNFLITTVLKKIPTPAADLEGSFWTSDSGQYQGLKGLPWFPDINGVAFGTDHLTTYTRNGAESTTGYLDTSIVKFGYNQIGNRVYFDGWNETTQKSVLYFGVISDDGNHIYADTYDYADARIPFLGTTDYSYGIPGETPYMNKK